MGNLLKFLIVLLFSFAEGGNSFAQSARLSGKALIDSLVEKLPNQKEDSNKVKLLNKLSNLYYNIDPGEGVKYGQQALALAEQLGWQKGIADANNRIGLNYCIKSDFPKALEHDFKALKLYEEIGNKTGIASITSNIGMVYEYQGDYPRALEYFLRALRIDEEIGHKQFMANVSGNIGVIYFSLGDYQKALQYGLKHLKIAEELGDKKGIADVTGNIGNIYLTTGEYAKALDYFTRSLKIAEEIDDRQSIAGTSVNIGSIYSKQYNYTESINWQFKALHVAREIGEKAIEAMALGGIGSNYISIVAAAKTNQLEEASELRHRAYVPDSLIPKGRDALLRKAKDYIDKAIAIDKEIGALDDLQTGYAKLSTVDSLLGDFYGALIAKSQYMVTRDSVFSRDNAVKIARLELQSKIETDSLKNVQARKMADVKFRHQRNYIYAGLAGIVCLLFFLFFIIRERGKSEAARKKSDELLLNILPHEVAQELKNKGSTQAQHYDNVTVLFTDFVNFTQAGEIMKPQELIDELHTCFKAFDEITAKYNIEKIKTIGDAYLAAGGIPVADDKHAENVVNAAKEITAFMLDRIGKLGSTTFEVRIGIHSGSVVAGIVGVKKFAYDIWGDAVNTAARMQQHSEPGKINISESTYQLVKGKFSCEYRGEIDAKNKGMMNMYFVS
ncbi:MAG: hypothetical protein K0Q79_903 [Flavipsychrobacter sp.]|jgi:class 3 adenylate cyclase/Tfp pilus assembly protein PilF|nr:hypothetical protein [Flavipsychrobacter sp.]